MLPFQTELKKAKEEVDLELGIRILFKVDCCSQCMREVHCSSDLDAKERAPVYTLYIGGRVINLCKRHLIKFSEAIDNYIVENYPEEMTNIRR